MADYDLYVYFCDVTRGRVTNLVGRDVLDSNLILCLYIAVFYIYVLVALFAGAPVRTAQIIVRECVVVSLLRSLTVGGILI